jgi:hypothetical protein
MSHLNDKDAQMKYRVMLNCKLRLIHTHLWHIWASLSFWHHIWASLSFWYHIWSSLSFWYHIWASS